LGLIAGIIAGAGVGLSAAFLGGALIRRRRRKQQQQITGQAEAQNIENPYSEIGRGSPPSPAAPYGTLVGNGNLPQANSQQLKATISQLESRPLSLEIDYS